MLLPPSFKERKPQFVFHNLAIAAVYSEPALRGSVGNLEKKKKKKKGEVRPLVPPYLIILCISVFPQTVWTVQKRPGQAFAGEEELSQSSSRLMAPTVIGLKIHSFILSSLHERGHDGHERTLKLSRRSCTLIRRTNIILIDIILILYSALVSTRCFQQLCPFLPEAVKPIQSRLS